MEASTKTERAIAFIQKKGAARTPEIAEHLGIPAKNVMPLLQSSLKKGVLVSCVVERPGQARCAEYRVVGAAPIGAGKGFTITPPAATKVQAATPPVKATLPANDVEKPEASHRARQEATKSVVSAETVGTPQSDLPTRLRFLISDGGELHIEEGGTCIALAREDTKRLWRFMGGFLGEGGDAR